MIPPNSSPNTMWTDFLIFGSGVAGLRAAIELAPQGSVLIVNKGRPLESTTGLAQGGIAVALEESDSWEEHFKDTLLAGKGLCVPESVEDLVKEGPLRVQELIEWGARFDQEGERYLFAREGGHSRSRILRAGGDATGAEISRVLGSKVGESHSITHLDHHFSADLLMDEGICVGAVLWKGSEGPMIFVGARGIILATGGGGQAYSRTTNPLAATGDGMAMAYRAGANMTDMEFVQFHPTAISLPGVPPLLLSEAMRGEGARLRTEKGEAFMARYHSDAELASRDTVSRAIQQEMSKSGSDHVYLDITHHSVNYLKDRFPTIFRTCLRHGFDISRDWIPVSPAAHFMIGGVETDTLGATSLPGLYAAGEVATCGIHGANRLASNSLLEGLVFGKRAAAALSKYHSSQADQRAAVNRAARDYLLRYQSKDASSSLPFHFDRHHLQEVMWRNVGIERTRLFLEEALNRMEDWKALKDVQPSSQEVGEDQNLLLISRLVASAALKRQESRGVHYRSDYGEASSIWEERHIRLTISEDEDP